MHAYRMKSSGTKNGPLGTPKGKLDILENLAPKQTLWVLQTLRPHCLTEVGLGTLLSTLPWRGAI